jgi:hypothetical protein
MSTSISTDRYCPGEILLEEFLKPMGVSQYRIVMRDVIDRVELPFWGTLWSMSHSGLIRRVRH